MDAPSQLPEIPEFAVWRDADGWHATWKRPLDHAELTARIPCQADARRFAELATACAWLRIRRDLTNRPRRRVWRGAAQASEVPFTTGDPT